MEFTMVFVCQYHKYSVCGIRQPEFFLRPSPWSILLCTSLWMSNKPIGSLLSLGVPRLTKFIGFSPIYGKQLACDCGQSMCHAELDELVRELVMSGAVANPDSSPLLRRTSRPFLSVFWCKGQPSLWNREKKNQEKDESDGHLPT